MKKQTDNLVCLEFKKKLVLILLEVYSATDQWLQWLSASSYNVGGAGLQQRHSTVAWLRWVCQLHNSTLDWAQI